jgi:hypothetical protein
MRKLKKAEKEAIFEQLDALGWISADTTPRNGPKSTAWIVNPALPVSMGLASVLYTFYPPMIRNPFYYIGVVLVVVGSWIWVALMAVNLTV